MGHLEENNTLNNIIGCVAIYHAIIDENSDVGDLKLAYFESGKNFSIQYFTCRKDWILETDRTNVAELRILLNKVLATQTFVGEEIW